MGYLTFSTSYYWLYQAIIVMGISIFARFLISLYKARRMIIRLKQQGLCMPPHNPLFGHLLVIYSILSKIPSDAHPLYLPDQLRRKYPEMGPVFYVDLWPFNSPILFVESPSAAYQLFQEHTLPKAAPVRNFMYPLTKNNDLVTMEGKLWKDWRSVFSPGFSANHLMTLVPEILEAVSTYSAILGEHTKVQDMFYLEQATINMTMDIIGMVTLGARFNAQRSANVFVSALREQILWLPTGSQLNPLQRLNLIRPLAQMYYNRQMDRYLSREIDSCFASHKQIDTENMSSARKPNTIIGLALDKYLQQQPASENLDNMNATFKEFAISQMKGLILAGHGTTSNSLCFVYYLLSINPSSLQRIREEHDNVLGIEIDQTSSIITQRPHVLNELPYTLAVIKETLRLFPADSSPRKGEVGFSLIEGSQQYPTEGCMPWTVAQAMHRDPRYWPEADSFIPERWLTSKDDPLHPIKGAWRAFEFGPRNCIGQELAMMEMKLALAMTIRKYDFSARFEEWEQFNSKRGPKTINGESAYQALKGTNRPRDGFPCRVHVRGP